MEVIIMAFKNDMKLGWIGYVYPVPANIEDPFERVKWCVDEAVRLQCHTGQLGARIDMNDDILVGKARELFEANGMEYEGRCPHEIFDLADGGDNTEKIAAIREACAEAKKLGYKIVRVGYNTAIHIDNTRWSRKPGWTGAFQLERMAKSLKEAAKIFEDEDIYCAVENHLDFSGKEYHEVFAEVNSPRMGCALDFANGLGAFVDPNLDVEYLAEHAFTTHVKDSKLIMTPFNGSNNFPYIPVGCTLGEGTLDIPKAIELLCEKSPLKQGLHLIIEQGWFGDKVAEENDMREFNYKTLVESLDYLKELIKA